MIAGTRVKIVGGTYKGSNGTYKGQTEHRYRILLDGKVESTLLHKKNVIINNEPCDVSVSDNDWDRDDLHLTADLKASLKMKCHKLQEGIKEAKDKINLGLVAIKKTETELDELIKLMQSL
jgi:hypothetical protein